LIFYKRDSGSPTISYEDAVDEALAFGWIDSIIKKIDDKRYARKFAPRRLGSVWSKYNLDRVNELRKKGRMTKWGLDVFERRTAKTSLSERFSAEPIRIPKDLELALKMNKLAWENFRSFGPSYRKRYLMWIAAAKRPGTRKKRIGEAVVLISRNVKDLLK
jgi:uncharacterized protein YdeI (YjbR/CyaY-like superfamily)